MATVQDFPRTTYSDTAVQRVVISDQMSIVKPMDTPLIAWLGGIDSKPGPGWKIQNAGPKVYWIERDVLGLDDTVITDATGWQTNSGTTLAVTDASLYHKGDILLVENEYIWVSSVNLSANTLSVVRGFGGSTAASHAANTAIAIVGNARLEGADSDAGAFLNTDTKYNVTQIFHDEVSVTGTEEATDYYGGAGIELETRLTLQRLFIKVERALIHGVRNDPSNNAAPRSLGGLNYWINQTGGNRVNAGTLGIDDFIDAMQQVFEDSSTLPDVALMSMTNARRCVNLFNTYQVTIPRSEKTVGMTVTRIVTPAGELNILIDRHMPNDRIFLLNKEHIAIYPLRPFAWSPLAVTGDATRRQVVGELTLLVRHPLKAHAVIYGITG